MLLDLHQSIMYLSVRCKVIPDITESALAGVVPTLVPPHRVSL